MYFPIQDLVYSLHRGPSTDILMRWEHIFLEILPFVSPGITPIDGSKVTSDLVDFLQLLLSKSTTVIQHVFTSPGGKPEHISQSLLPGLTQSVLQTQNATC